MAFNITPLELEEIPMKLNAFGIPEFCEMRDEAFLANFALHLSASAADEWEITSVYIGTQELRGETRRRFARHFEDTRGMEISDHVAENLPDAKEQAAYDQRAFLMGR